MLSDEGASEKSLNRPGLTEALGLVEDGTAEIIIVSKLDRLSRSVHDFRRPDATRTATRVGAGEKHNGLILDSLGAERETSATKAGVQT